jgi:putative ABC transport system permease protein
MLIAVLGRPALEHFSHLRSGGLRFYPLALAALAGLSLLTGVLAALVPAWIASRQDVVTSLAGRRGVVRSRRRWLVAGLALVAAGTAVAGFGAYRVDWAIILIGLAGVELGLVLCTPSVVGMVARLGQLLPVTLRVALRDTARNRTSAAPAISAIMAAVIGGLAVGILETATVRQAAAEYRTLGRLGDVSVLNIGGGPKGGLSTPLTGFSQATLDALRSTLPVDQIVEVGRPSCAELCELVARPPMARQCPFLVPDDGEQMPAADQRAARRDPRCDSAGRRYTYLGFSSNAAMIFVVDERAAGVLASIPAADMDAVASALRGGSVVVGDPSYVENGRVSLEHAIIGPDGTGTRRPLSVSGFALPHPTAVPVALMTAATAGSLGFEVSPLALLATTTRMPTVEEQDRAQSALGQGLPLFVERGQRAGDDSLLILTIIAALITLGATAIATGLAAADGRADLATLGAVGASPRVRRLLSVWQSGVIAGLGSLLGVVAGVGLALAVLVALNQRYAGIWPAPTPFPISVPWLNVVVAIVVVPLVAMLGAGLLTRSRLPIERRL